MMFKGDLRLAWLYFILLAEWIRKEVYNCNSMAWELEPVFSLFVRSSQVSLRCPPGSCSWLASSWLSLSLLCRLPGLRPHYGRVCRAQRASILTSTHRYSRKATVAWEGRNGFLIEEGLQLWLSYCRKPLQISQLKNL